MLVDPDELVIGLWEGFLMAVEAKEDNWLISVPLFLADGAKQGAGDMSTAFPI